MNQSRAEATVAPLAMASEQQALPLVHVEEPVTITIFGASGDLTLRKLLPALYALFAQGLFREQVAIIGFARREYTNEAFRQHAREAIHTFSRLPVENAALDRFCSRIYYHQGDLHDVEAYSALRNRLQDGEVFPPNRACYLAIAPDYFLSTIVNLHRAELIYAPRTTPWCRLVIEKPFGRDLESARKLNQDVLADLDEAQIYRIDHYLGKETVQNILGFRLANSIFEPVLPDLPTYPYVPGSWGPAAADVPLTRDGFAWRNPD